MELKSIEMQVALPRTHDAGKQAQLMQQEGQQIIDHASDQMEKELIEKRQNVIGNNQKDIIRLKKEQRNNQSNRKRKEKRNKCNTDEQKHPYKGNKIDFSG